MTRIHARNNTTCTKETKGYFRCIVKLSSLYYYTLYIYTNRHNQTLCIACECMRVSIMRFSKYMHALNRFQRRRRKNSFAYTAHCIYSVESSANFIHSNCCVCIATPYDCCMLFLPFCHVLQKCQCAEYDVMRVCNYTYTLILLFFFIEHYILSVHSMMRVHIYIYMRHNQTFVRLPNSKYARTNHSIHFSHFHLFGLLLTYIIND